MPPKIGSILGVLNVDGIFAELWPTCPAITLPKKAKATKPYIGGVVASIKE
jgi:hypothetical protein